jgi:2-keto-3-deoxy-L-rhamnonate aldolase RhmA
MGIPGQFDDQRFLDGLQKVVATAQKHGLKAGIQPANVEQAQGWMAMGFNVISYSSDFAVYLKGLAEGVSQIRSLGEG